MVLDVAAMDFQPESLLSGTLEEHRPHHAVAEERGLVPFRGESIPQQVVVGEEVLPIYPHFQSRICAACKA